MLPPKGLFSLKRFHMLTRLRIGLRIVHITILQPLHILYGESCKCRKILVFGKQLGRNPTDAQIFLMFYLQKKPKQK